jgi:hypothetical protein
MTFSHKPEAVWKIWDPPKCKLFAWLVLQNCVWTTDRLQKCGWTNCGVCQLCKREPESAAHLLFTRIWNSLLSWLGIISVNTSTWSNFEMIEDWWLRFVFVNGNIQKSFASLIMLTSCEIWNERNARVFRNVSTIMYGAQRVYGAWRVLRTLVPSCHEGDLFVFRVFTRLVTNHNSFLFNK